MTRRLLIGAGMAAAAAGIAWSWFGARRPAPVAADFWQQRFPRPDGGELALASLRGRPLVLNFWATWCAPCIRELPVLDAFQRTHATRGWQVVGIAIDTPQPVRTFLARQPLSIQIGLAGFEGTTLAGGLGNSKGLLPFTVVFDATGAIRQRKLGETTADELERWREQVDS